MLKKYYEFQKKKLNFYKKFASIQFIISLASIFFWVFAFKSSVLDANNIPSGSMQPTLKIGDFLFVNKMRYTFCIPFTDVVLFRLDKPHRGDIVTFTPPHLERDENEGLRGKTLVKRIIGVPGDHIKVVDDEIYINDIPYKVQIEKDQTVLKDLDVSANEKLFLQLHKEEIRDPINKNLIVKHYMLKNRIFIKPADKTRNLRTPYREWLLDKDEYFAMGDNRDNSDDSRRWGKLPLANIHGKVFMSYFSINWNESQNVNDNPRAKPTNPIFNIFHWIIGQKPNASVRWNRAGMRIY